MLNEDKQLLLATITPNGTNKTARQKYLREEIRKQQKELESLNSNWNKAEQQNKMDLTSQINDFLLDKGIDRFGITTPDPSYMYKNARRDIIHKSLIVFVVPMRYKEMKEVPSLNSATEILRAYSETGKIVVALTKFIQEKGFNAFGHHPLGDLKEYHHILLPPHAVAAGLGEKGRTGLFIDHKYGPLVRLGAVSTNAKLPLDSPKDKGITAFCHRCRYCAKFCPPKAIDNTKYVQQLSEGNFVDFKIEGDRCIKYFAKHYACGKCIFHCVLAQPTPEEFRKRIDRIETWYNRWVKNGPPDEWKELFLVQQSSYD